MVKVTEKIAKWQAEKPGTPWFSFEYFPPKTDLGVQNLYERFDRMAQLDPMWIDVTWGAGGSTSEKTLELCINALKYHNLNVMMHLTCTNMPKESLKAALTTCKENGIMNILALRGDPPGHLEQGEKSEGFKQVEGGFAYATDLVKYIRAEFGDYFCIAVAGYPEGHLEATSFDDDMKHLKTKVDAGADLIVTQLFYDNEGFLEYVDKCKKMGITIPILPGIMPIQSYGGFSRMTSLCKTKVPQHITDALDPVKDDDEKVKDKGVEIAIKQCRELVDKGTPGLHFYTLNLETSVMRIVQGLGLVPDWTATREMPWKQSADVARKGEDVRPIFWANRPGSYIKRTTTWDDFPNGRFGDRASPAYGEFVSWQGEAGDKATEKLREMWGSNPKTEADVNAVFEAFMKNEVKRLPWCSECPAVETNFIAKQLMKMNSLGLLTINSQPRVNASLSTDPYVGWGPTGGFVYQKAYCEFFCKKEVLDKIVAGMANNKFFSYMAVDKKGTQIGNVKHESVNAVTWGIFPGREVMQPTVVDVKSFMAWKDEAFALWDEWSSIYAAGSDSCKLIQAIPESYFLVNVVDNNFVAGDLLNDLIALIS